MAIITIGQLLSIKRPDVFKSNNRIKLVRHKDTRTEQTVNGQKLPGNPYDWYPTGKSLSHTRANSTAQ